jgi:hypothetical protein
MRIWHQTVSPNDPEGFSAIGSRRADGRFPLNQRSDDEFEKKPYDPSEAFG